MAYSDFTFAKIKQRFGIEQQSIYLFKQAKCNAHRTISFFII